MKQIQGSQNMTDMNFWCLVFTPFLAFGKVVFVLFATFIWFFFLDSVTSNPAATPGNTMKDVFGLFFSKYYIIVPIIYGLAYFFYKRQSFYLSIALSLIAAILGYFMGTLLVF